MKYIYSCIVLVFFFSASVKSQSVDQNLWGTNGTVNTTIVDGSILYIGGSFSQIGPNTGHGAVLDTLSGIPDLSYPKVNNTIRVVISDGSGGWYIGGDFAKIGSVTRNKIAHIKPDKSLDLNWDPNADGTVHALAISGNILYVGGSFNNIDGQVRNRVAAISIATGNATTWDPNADNTVNALAVNSNSVIVGGEFTNIGGQTRNYIAKIAKVGGTIESWNPNAGGFVHTIAVSGNFFYIGGEFSSIGGQTRHRLAQINFAGVATSWNPNANNIVYSIVLGNNSIYVGGAFTNIGGQTRNRIAELNGSIGLATTWNPNATTSVFSVVKDGPFIYAGGNFQSIGGQNIKYLAKIDLSGNVTSWNPGPGAPVKAICVSGSSLYAGGLFNIVGGQPRSNIAAINTSTGIGTNWIPNSNSTVYSMYKSGILIFVGGSFTNIGGTPRNRIAALSATTGLSTVWNPDASNTVRTLLGDGAGFVYAGGDFQFIGGQSRHKIAKLDFSGNPTAWDPNANGTVRALALSGNDLFVGGDFSNIGGQSNNNALASISTSTGLTTTWNANLAFTTKVYSLNISGNLLYVGGQFISIGGQIRANIAALDKTTAIATSWNPNADDIVKTINILNNTVYIGGNFTTVGGQTRNHIAAIDTASGNLTPWNPNLNTGVNSLTATSNYIYAGGNFTSADGIVYSNLAGISISTTGTITITSPNGGEIFNQGSLQNITWTSSGITDVKIEYSADNGSTYTTIVSSTTANTGSYNWTIPAVPTMQGIIKISDVNNSSVIDTSDAVFRIKLAKPVLITPVNNATEISLSPSLNWTAVTGADSYRLEINASSGFQTLSQLFDSSTVTNNSKIIGGLKDSITFYWRVTALNSNGNSSDVSEIFNFLTKYVQLISPPDGATSVSTSPTLSWASILGADSSRLEVNKLSDFSGTVIIDTMTADTTKELSGITLENNVVYYWRVTGVSNFRKVLEPINFWSFTTTIVTDVKEELILPLEYSLAQNFPNPFNPITNIKYTLPEASFVTLKIYNIIGQEVKTLIDEQKNAGTFNIQWKGDNNFGQKVSSGTYIYRIIAGEHKFRKKMILLR